MMRLVLAELRKVWAARVFPLLLAVLALANLLLLWMGTRPTPTQTASEVWRQAGQILAPLSMEERGAWIHGGYNEMEALLRLDSFYRDYAWADAYTKDYYDTYRQENAELFETYDEEYRQKSYTLLTGSVGGDYRFFLQLQNEYDAVAGYQDFLTGVQEKARQLAGISIFQNDKTGYDLKNIEKTAQVYAGLGAVPIDYYPQKGLYTAISYAFTDLILLAAMLLLALLLVRQERDSGLLALVRSLPAGRWRTAAAKLLAFALSLLAVILVLYGVNLGYCQFTYGLGPLGRSIQSVLALMRCTQQITVLHYLGRFLLAKWAGAFVLGLWVMLAALAVRRTAAGWLAALAMPALMAAVRAAVSPSGHWAVIRYANLISLLQTNELLGIYRNLYWFGSPVPLPLVEWAAALFYGGAFAAAFCLVFARAQLLPASPWSLALGKGRKTRPTTVLRAEGYKLWVVNGAALVLAAFVGLGIWQGVHAESYLDAEEIYYSYYMKHISGPYTKESYDWLAQEYEGFLPMLEAQALVSQGKLSPEVLYAFSMEQQKYGVYQSIVQGKLGQYLPQHEGAWLVYETGWLKLFGTGGTADIQDTLLCGLACALCFAGLFSMERRGGMLTVVRAAPLGRLRTVQAKLRQSAVLAALISLASALPHFWQVLRDYGLPAALAPANSIEAFVKLPGQLPLAGLLLFWLVCRAAACTAMAFATLWLGHRFGRMLPALFVSAVLWCLPCLLSLSGMKGGIEWLGAYPLFHAAALCTTQGYSSFTGEPFSLAWYPVFLLGLALVLILLLRGALLRAYRRAGA